MKRLSEKCFKHSSQCLKLSIEKCIAEVYLASKKDISKYLPVILVAGFLAISSMLFQNCAGYSANGDTLLTTDNSAVASSCTGSDLSCSDLNNVQLTIANQDPLYVTATPVGSNGSCDSSNCVDVSGYCDAAGFSVNKISASVIGNGTANLPDQNLGSCDANGRFRILVPMPSPFVAGTNYTVNLVMRIYDASGNAYENPSSLNRKSISLTSTTQ